MSNCLDRHEKRLLFIGRRQPLRDCQEMHRVPFFFLPQSMCVMCGSCCCDQSQFNRHRLKVNLRGAMKADR